MELSQEDKNNLTIYKFFTNFKKEFKISGIRIKSLQATKQDKFDPVSNIYPLIIHIENWPLSYRFHWTNKTDKELGFPPMVESITNKNGDDFTMEQIKLYIQEIVPEMFKRDFYQNKTDISMNKINDSYSNIEKKVKAIQLAQELDSSLIENSKNQNQVAKKIKV